MKRRLHSPSVRRHRLFLAIAANVRAGGIRRSCMTSLAKKVGVYHSLKTLETDLLLYAGSLMDPGCVTRLLTWNLQVNKATDEMPPPVFIPRQQLALAA